MRTALLIAAFLLAGCTAGAADTFTEADARAALVAVGAQPVRVLCVELTGQLGRFVFCNALTDEKTFFDVLPDPAGPGAIAQERQQAELELFGGATLPADD